MASTDLVNRLLGKQGFAKNALTPVVDPRMGAQFGFMPNFRELPSNTPYTRKPMIPIVVQGPKAFDYLDGGQLIKDTLKVLMEEHPLSIEGINLTMTPEFAETAVGGAGQKLKIISNMMLAESAPSFSYQEKYGKVLTRFFTFWHKVCMMNPETKFPDILSMAVSGMPEEILEDFMSMTMLFIEPDPTHRYVVEAALISNMMPSSGIPRELVRNLPEGDQALQFSMEFTGVTESTDAVFAFAQEVLSSISLTGVSPNNRPAAMDAIHADYLASTRGYKESIAAAAAASVGAKM
jgi:hypothetical protein